MEKAIDDILLRRMIENDEKAFSDLYELYWEPLFLYVIRILDDQEDAEDVIQETFLSIWQLKERLNHIKSLKGYLYAVARNNAIKVIQKKIQKKDYLSSLIDFFVSYEYSPEEQLVTQELSSLIDKGIADLPAKMRKIFILSRQEGLSYKEIAAKQGISDQTVKKQIHNSLKLIRLKVDSQQLKALVLLFLLKQL